MIDSSGTQCKLILLWAAFFSLVVSLGVLAYRGPGGFECVCLLLCAITGSLFLISSADLMCLFLSLEIQSLCFYVLAATGRTSEFSTEAGLKYLVLGAFSSGVLLFGTSLLYGFSGTTSLLDVSNLGVLCATETSVGAVQFALGSSIGVLFILFGLLFKIGAAPFHSWVPDVYEGSPVFITTFFAAVPKVAILSFLLRLCAPMLAVSAENTQGLLLSSILN